MHHDKLDEVFLSLQDGMIKLYVEKDCQSKSNRVSDFYTNTYIFKDLISRNNLKFCTETITQ